MNSIVLSSFSHLNRDQFKGYIRRTVSIVLMLVLAGGSGSPMFARSLVEPVVVLNEQLTRLSQFANAPPTSKPHAAGQGILEDRRCSIRARCAGVSLAGGHFAEHSLRGRLQRGDYQ